MFYPFFNRTKVRVEGKNNKILLQNENGDKISRIKGLTLVVKGCNNTICIKEPADFEDCIVWVEGDGGTFIFEGSELYIKNTTVKVLKGGYVKIGGGISIINGGFICSQGAKITLGKDCMLAANITIRDNDGHSIYDKKGKLLNPVRDITIGDHVWIGMRSVILKGVTVGDGSIIGAGSVVTKGFKDKNVIIAGNPAHIIKKDIHWER